MASWKDDLVPASFRGVPFFIDTSQFVTGRRTIQHEFPDRNIPYAEDMGRISDTFRVDGHLIGDNLFELKRQMKEAVQKHGPGELIHPYYGVQQVQCGSVSFDDDTKEGRISRVIFEFREAGNNRFPRNVDDKQSILDGNVSAVEGAAGGAFEDVFSVAGLPGHAVDTARDGVSKAADAFNDATKPFATVSDGIADLAFSTRNLVADVDDLLQSPAKLQARLLGSLALLAGALSLSKDKQKAYRGLTNFGNDDEPILGSTPTRDKERENQTAFNDLVKQAAVASSVLFAADSDFESVEEATQERNDLTDIIQEQSENTEDDNVYQSLRDLNSSLMDLVPDKDSDLPNIETFTPKITCPSLVLLYDRYEDLSSEQNLIDRNDIRHPGFIPGGEELEVIDVRKSS